MCHDPPPPPSADAFLATSSSGLAGLVDSQYVKCDYQFRKNKECTRINGADTHSKLL